MKRKFLIILFSAITAFVCIFGLSACFGGENGDNGDEEQDKTPVKTEIKYELLEDGKSYVCSGLITFSETETDITVASEYNGLKVTSIGDSAFADCDRLSSVTIPNSVTSIGKKAFYGCQGLIGITISNKVTSIGEQAFGNCPLIIIYCESREKPVGWANNWAETCPVVWDYENNYYADDGNSYVVEEGIRYSIKYDSAEVDRAYLLKGEVEIPASITLGRQKYSVTSINAWAAHGCDELTGIVIPDSVTSIGADAFFNCSKLADITLPDSVISIGAGAFQMTAYYKDESNWQDQALYIGRHLVNIKSTVAGNFTIKPGTLTVGDSVAYKRINMTSLTIPDSVNLIGGYAFEKCDGLKSITIPRNVKKVGEGAFRNCSGLESVYWDATNCKIGGSGAAFNGCENLKNAYFGESVEIPSGIFFECSNLTNIIIPDSVVNIGYNSFNGCAYYNEEINWQDDVLYIGKHLIAARNTISGDYTIKQGTITIGTYAFYECDKLTSITIPDSVKAFGFFAFERCVGLISVYYMGNVDGWCGMLFDSYEANPVYCASNFFISGELVSDIVVPEDVTVIGRNTFSYSGLTSITISDSVKSIGFAAFEYCRSLKNVIIGNGATSIEAYTFESCSELTSITIGKNVSSIDKYALGMCGKLKDIYFNGTKEQWLAIDKSTNWDYGTSKYTVHCTDGDVEKS